MTHCVLSMALVWAIHVTGAYLHHLAVPKNQKGGMPCLSSPEHSPVEFAPPLR